MIFDKTKFVRHFVRNRVSEFDTNAVSSEVLLYRNNDRMIDRFVILIHNSTVHKGVRDVLYTPYASCIWPNKW